MAEYGDWSAEFLRSLLQQAPAGIIVAELRGDGQPVVYVNAACERICGQRAAELLGTDLQRLMTEREQAGRSRPLLETMRDAAGTATHVIGFWHEPGEQERSAASAPLSLPASGLPRWMREDRLSGLCSRPYFDELLRHDWEIAMRDGRMLTLLMFDIDALGAYNDTFGRAAGDACIRRVAGVIAASFRRRSDIVARWEGGTICALVHSHDVTATTVFVESIVQRIAEQHIHHPRAATARIVSARAAVVSLNPGRDREPMMLVNAGLRALQRARTVRNSRVVVAGEADFGG